MKIIVNGEEFECKTDTTLFTLLEQKDVIDMMIGVAQNGTVVPRDEWDHTEVKLGDIIEIVSPIQGG